MLLLFGKVLFRDGAYLNKYSICSICNLFECYFFLAKLQLPEDEAEEVARDMEGIITFYCKSRNEKYNSTSGLTEVLAPFMMLELPMNDVYNCFYAMLYKYIPR